MMAMPTSADRDMREHAIGNLGENEVAGKGQKHAETKGLQRMLAANDRRPEDPAISAPASRAARTTTVITASDRKCTMRSTSRLVLSIG